LEEETARAVPQPEPVDRPVVRSRRVRRRLVAGAAAMALVGAAIVSGQLAGSGGVTFDV
jgi:hypothetical protein